MKSPSDGKFTEILAIIAKSCAVPCIAASLDAQQPGINAVLQANFGNHFARYNGERACPPMLLKTVMSNYSNFI
ncbi:hypothetical protein VXD91_04495 [Mycobacterium sp. SM3041]